MPPFTRILSISLCFGAILSEATLIASDHFQNDIRPILRKHCFTCHSGKEAAADLKLDRTSSDLIADPPAAEIWHDVRAVINLGEMPPDDEPQLSQADRTALLRWLDTSLEHAANIRRSNGGRVVLRRLNRVEYQNTMRDLLGMDIDFVRDFPPDGVSKDGMQNDGSILQMSGIQLEYYLDAARRAMDKAILTNSRPEVHIHRFDAPTEQRWPKTNVATRLGRDRVYVVKIQNTYPDEGRFRVRVVARAELPEQRGPIPRMRVLVGYRPDTLTVEETLAELDITQEGSQTYEFFGRIENFPRPVRGQGKYPGLAVTIQNAYDEFGKPLKRNTKGEDGKRKGVVFDEDTAYPYLVIESVEFEGPLADEWPPAHHTRIMPQPTEDTPEYIRDVLSQFLNRAWRRPVSRDETDRFVKFFQRIRPAFPDLESAMRETLVMALISPEFLYLLEPANNESRSLTAFELASRLSYFLWSTMPDEELMNHAATGALLQRETLEQQVDRMIDDPRCWQFVEQFTGQWLDLNAIDRLEIDTQSYAGFRSELKADMKQEVQHFFAHILRNNLSARNFLSSDFMMVNDDLARHYGITGVHGGDFRMIPVPETTTYRGGLLTQAAVLMGTSTGRDSNLIKRAVFIRDRLLDDPPSPPPPNVPELKTADPEFAKLPIREQLTIHRDDPACADCHRGIDPWGQAMEQFDALGLWRETIGRRVGKRSVNLPVDAAATMPDGAEIDGIEELKSYLITRRSRGFARSLVTRLMTYGLGRRMEYLDEPEIDAVTERFVSDDMKLRTLLKHICNSKTFRTK